MTVLRGRRSEGLVAILAGLAAAGLYVSTLTADNSFDAVIFASFVERAAASGPMFLELFQPQHVAHLPLATALTLALHAAGAPVGGLLVLQLMAAIAGGCAVALFVACLRPHAGLPLALAASASWAVASGTWFFATEGETNLPAIALALAAIPPALRLLGDDARGRTIVAAGACLGLACAFHLTLGTLWIALLVIACARGRARRVVMALAVASIVLACAYVPRVMMLMETGAPWSAADLVTFTAEAPGGAYLLRSGFTPWAEWLGLVHGAGPGPSAIARVGQALPWLWLVAGAVAIARRRMDALAQLAGTWFLLTLALYAAWANPTDFEFQVFLTTPLTLLGAASLARLARREPAAREPRRSLAIAGMVGALAACSAVAAWTHLIRDGLSVEKNPFRALASVVEEAAGEDDCVLVTGASGTRAPVYVAYFAGRRTIIPELTFGSRISSSESLRRMEARVDAQCGARGTLFATPDVVEPLAADQPRPAWDHDAVRSWARDRAPRVAARDETTGRPLLYALERAPRAAPPASPVPPPERPTDRDTLGP